MPDKQITEPSSEENSEIDKPEIKDSEADAKPGISGYFKFFIPDRKALFASPIILDINIIVFLMMIFSGVNIMDPSINDLIFWGGNFREAVFQGELWRLITCLFVHAGVKHLIVNMVSLIYLSILMETLLGVKRYVMVYFISGIFSSISSLYFNANTVSVGASGAIFGLLGAVVSLFFTKLINKEEKKLYFIEFSVLIIVNIIASFSSGIDTAGHFGGLVSGMIVSFAFYMGMQYKSHEKTSLYLTPIISLVVGVFLLIVMPAIKPMESLEVRDKEAEEKSLAEKAEFERMSEIFRESYKMIKPRVEPEDKELLTVPVALTGDEYQDLLRSLSAKEAMAIEFNSWYYHFTPELLQHKLKTVGIYYWKENLAALESKRNSYLKKHPEHRKEYNLLFNYYHLRINSDKKMLEYFNSLSEPGRLISSKRRAKEFILKVESEKCRANIRVFEGLLKENLPMPENVKARISLLREYYQLLMNHYKILEMSSSVYISDKIKENEKELSDVVNLLERNAESVKW